MSILLAKNGTARVASATVKGVGTYRVKGDRVLLTLTRRNGSVPSNPAERDATLQIAENGNALLAPTGRREKGMDVLLRLVRKR